MLMALLDLDAPQALARLRTHSFAQEQSVTAAARDVLAGRVRFDDQVHPARLDRQRRR